MYGYMLKSDIIRKEDILCIYIHRYDIKTKLLLYIQTSTKMQWEFNKKC